MMVREVRVGEGEGRGGEGRGRRWLGDVPSAGLHNIFTNCTMILGTFAFLLLTNEN